MIQPQELRIDNLISDINGNLCLVKIIREDLIIAKYHGVGSCIGDKEQFKPVELTEEILLKLGFNEVEGERWCDMHEEFEECNYYYLSAFKIYYNPETDRFEDDSLYHFNVNLKYVHQLQNIYFCLCGKELTFKN